MNSNSTEKKKGKKGKKGKDSNLVDISTLPLPPGWEKKFSKEKNKAYYIDHNTRDTYWRHPLDPKFKPKKPKEEAVAAPPPMPLDMPTSTLANKSAEAKAEAEPVSEPPKVPAKEEPKGFFASFFGWLAGLFGGSSK